MENIKCCNWGDICRLIFLTPELFHGNPCANNGFVVISLVIFLLPLLGNCVPSFLLQETSARYLNAISQSCKMFFSTEDTAFESPAFFSLLF